MSFSFATILFSQLQFAAGPRACRTEFDISRVLLVVLLDVCNLETAGKYCTLPRTMEHVTGAARRRPVSMTGILVHLASIDLCAFTHTQPHLTYIHSYIAVSFSLLFQLMVL